MWPSIVPPRTVPTPSPLNEIKLALQPSGEKEGGGPGGRGGQAPARAAGGRQSDRDSWTETVERSNGAWQLHLVLRPELVLWVNMVPCLLLSLLLLVRPAPVVAYSVSLPASFLEEVAGSGEAEGSSASSPSLLPPRTPAFSPTPGRTQPTAPVRPVPPTNLLDGIVDFFRQYVMLIAVVGSLTFLIMFIVCAALITRQKHKATAYYPSSFPEKKYVDQRDRAGGPRAFSEVPDRAPDSRQEEGLDSSQQLQADILAATQNLRSPARALPGSGEGTKQVKGGSEEEKEEEVFSSQEEPREAPVCGVTEEKPEVPDESASVEAEGVPAASEGQGEPEGSFSLAQEPQGAAGPSEKSCACNRVSPSV